MPTPTAKPGAADAATDVTAGARTNETGTPDLTENGTSVEFSPEINIYAIETVRTEKDNFTRQGFGYSTKLDAPEKTTLYFVEGPVGREGRQVNIPGKKNIEDAARAISEHYVRATRETQLTFTLRDSPPEGFEVPYFGGTSTARALHGDEFEAFIEAFCEKNGEVAARLDQEDQRKAEANERFAALSPAERAELEKKLR